MLHSKMYSLIISVVFNNKCLLPEAQQHLLGLVDQFFLGNPEKDYKALFIRFIITMETHSLSIKTQVKKPQ